jgi:hypothetical protein
MTSTIQELEFRRLQEPPAVEPLPTVQPPRLNGRELRAELARLDNELRKNSYRTSVLGWREEGDMEVARLQLERLELVAQIDELTTKLGED